MFNQRKLLTLCVALSAIFGGATQASADVIYTPISATVSTVQTPYLYLSINDKGTLGNGSSFPGIQHDPTGTGTFITDRDYLQPGSPFEGFYVNATNESASYLRGNNNSGSSSFSTTGTLTNSSTLHNADVSWVGSNGDIGMTIDHRYTFSDASQYIKIRTTLTADQNLTGVQFLRILDPDQDAQVGNYDTVNTLGLTTSSGKVIPASDAAVASGSIRPDLKVIIYTNSAVPHAAGISEDWDTNPDHYLGATPLDDGDGDYSIAVAYQVGDLDSGESTELVYYYLFSDSDEVLDSLITEIITGGINWRAYMEENGGNKNARSVGGVLDALTEADGRGQATADQQYLIDNFEASDPDNYVTLATTLAGEIHAAMAAEVPLSSIWLRDAVSGALYKSQGSDSCKPIGKTVWVTAGRSWDTWYGDSHASGISADRNQYAFGYDLVSSDQLRAGFGGYYAHIDVDGANSSSGDADKKLVFGYGQYGAGKVQFDGIVALGAATWKTSRSVTLGGTTERFYTDKTGLSGLAGLTVSMPMSYAGIGIQPYVSGLLVHEERGPVSEGDSPAALTLPGFAVDGTRVSLGVTLASACRNPLLSPTTFKLNLEGGLDSSGLANPHVEAELGGVPYNIVSPTVSQGYFQTIVEGTARLGTTAYCYADYIGTFRGGAQSHGVELGLRITL